MLTICWFQGDAKRSQMDYVVEWTIRQIKQTLDCSTFDETSQRLQIITKQVLVLFKHFGEKT